MPITRAGAVPTRARTSSAFGALLVLLAALLASASPAHAADAGAEQRFVALLNSERTNRGLPALQVNGELQAVARRHSARMARDQRMYHNPNVSNEVGGYRRLGENVGTGGSADEVHAAFMRSSPHRANILSPDFTQVGVGVEWNGGKLYVTQVFRQPDGSQPPPPPPPQQQPAPQPPPAKQPAPQRTQQAAPPPPPAPEPEPEPEPASTRLRLNFARVEAEDSGTPAPNLIEG